MVVSDRIVTAAAMAAIEAAVFAAGLPVAALMEKAGLALFGAIASDYPEAQTLGVVVGSGHNGGDALVVAREWVLAGRGGVKLWLRSPTVKPLTQAHADYVRYLGAEWVPEIAALQDCDVLVDGLFGWGLNRPLGVADQDAIAAINRLEIPIASIDVPSGLDADRGEDWGAVIRADRTYCLGLWKRGLVQDQALEAVGVAKLLDLGLPALAHDGNAVRCLHQPAFPTPPAATHKYQQGHLLIIAGSLTYPGAALLAGLGARPSGVGMITLAVPRELAALVTTHLPEVLVAPYDQQPNWDRSHYSAIAVGPGLTDVTWLPELLQQPLPLVLDAGALVPEIVPLLSQRSAVTVMTPHWGEFRRLFGSAAGDRIERAQAAATQTGATVVLKGARTIIATGTTTWVNLQSTVALARGGSGDVLTGLIGGLLAQGCAEAAALGVWWHSQSAIALAAKKGITAVDPVALAGQLSYERRRFTM